MSLNENVYINSDNDVDLIVSDKDGPIDFISNGVTLIEVYYNAQTISSATDAITYADAGKVTLKLGHEAGLISGGKYNMILKAFDPAHPDGQVLIAPSMSDSCVVINAHASEL